jgi:hypothetical protein
MQQRGVGSDLEKARLQGGGTERRYHLMEKIVFGVAEHKDLFSA